MKRLEAFPTDVFYVKLLEAFPTGVFYAKHLEVFPTDVIHMKRPLGFSVQRPSPVFGKRSSLGAPSLGPKRMTMVCRRTTLR